MTKIKFIALILFTAFISSCSSDDSGDENQSAYFNFIYDNKVQNVKTWEALKQEDFIEVLGTSEEGIVIDFKFNVYGNLYQALTNPAVITSDVPWLAASENFTSNTFIFTLENLDTNNKTVQVKYSGKVFENEYDYESEYINVSGSFKVSYTEITPEIQGLGTFAKIDGKDWHGLVMHSTVENQQTKILYAENDGKYTIGITFPDYEPKVGNFAFSSNSFANRISFQEYDVVTHEYIDYNVSGTVNYTTLNDYFVEGTFSLTATHPVTKSKIVISNGTFKENL
jgi:hypothetical protein